ncbi:YeeE/YedE family protein [Thalassotalea euphylliae]|uniref:YeeE/YedE family protein n=1 Tax=Thalassotalea euphylliae TaxID=1655234 RepID=A0A3E0TRD1_9GAMM|nr:DUF6691 family protein [Thalassotalea euphylliae]REL27211.1 YeeE/YedE family protein [Thalassotalea euphylliae]
MKLVLALLIGTLFGFGLSLAQMTNPLAVIGFLDITGNWDFRLALVMCSALLTTLVGYQFIFAKQSAPLFSGAFKLPSKTNVDWQLVIGAALFGVGWGLSGYCPGPAIASISINPKESLLFITAMLVGMKLKL